MTAIPVVPATARDRDRRDRDGRFVPWRRLARVAWLQHRLAVISLVVIFVVLALAAVAGEHGVRAEYASYLAKGCLAPRPTSTACATLSNTFADSHSFSVLLVMLRVLPVIVGLFVGAPLLSQELESGTFRFAWTQGAGRTRVVLTSLALLAAVVATAAVLLGLLLGGWYAHPFEVINSPAANHWQSGLFATTGWMLATWTLFALALGALLGAVIKRTVAAMATTAAVVGALVVIASVCINQMLAIGASVSSRFSPSIPSGAYGYQALPRSNDGPAGSLLVRGWLTGPGGRVLGADKANAILEQALGSKGGQGGAASWLSLHHYTFWVAYQPAARFWVFQGVEGAIVLALAVLCALATIRCIRGKVRA